MLRSARSPHSLLALFAAFMLGACATVAVQSAASQGADVDADADADVDEPAAPSPAGAATVLALADAPRATAPNGKGTIAHLARGQNAYLGLLRMDAGGAVPAHRDPTEEYIHILAGAGTMTIDGVRYPVETGATIYMPAKVEVSFENGPQELVALQVFAGPAPAAKYEAWTPLD